MIKLLNVEPRPPKQSCTHVVREVFSGWSNFTQSLGLRNPELSQRYIIIARMFAIHVSSIHACNSTCAKTDLYCVVELISVIETEICPFLSTIEVKSWSVKFISASRSVVFFSDCPQCNDLYRCRSSILASLDLHAHINIELLGMWSRCSFRY